MSGRGGSFVPVALGGAVLLLVGLVLWSELDSRLRQREIENLLAAQADALVEALGHAVEHGLVASREIEDLASARLLDDAHLLDQIETTGRLDRTRLDSLASDLGLRRAVIYDDSLRPVLEGGLSRTVLAEETSALAPLATGAADELVLGPRPTADGSSLTYSAAVRRSRGGAILVEMSAEEMLAFRDSIGAANLMAAVDRTGGILYAVLEGPDGSVLAGSPPDPASGAEHFLERSRPVEIAYGTIGRLKVGLSGEAVDAAARAGRRRTVGAVLVAMALAAATGALVVARRRTAEARGETARVRTLQDAVLDGIGDAVIVTDPAGVIRLVNPAAAALFGGAPADLTGRPCTETPCGAILEQAPAGGTPTEIVLRREDGTRRTVLATSSEVRDEGGRIFGTAVLLRDLTEMKRLELDARRTESSAAFARLAATVAHEVRNPLNAISIGVQRLERELPAAAGPPGRPGPPEGHARLIALLRGEIQRLDGIVTRFLAVARPSQLHLVEGDLDHAIREAATLLSSGLPAGMRLLVETGGAAGRFDPEAIRQILHNLVRNAAEAMGDRGIIRIRTGTLAPEAPGAGAPVGTRATGAPAYDRVRASGRRTGGTVFFEVSDDGPGIPPSDLERVFEFGFTTRPRGNGLGLPIVHRLATEMGGRVTIDSVSGGGTTVRIELPAAVPSSPAARESA